MKISLETALAAKKSLHELSTCSGLKARTSYNIGKALRKLSEPTASYEKIQAKRLEELGEKDKDDKAITTRRGNQIFYALSKDDQKILEKEMEELRKEEIDLGINEIELSEFENSDIKPVIFADLEWLIKE